MAWQSHFLFFAVCGYQYRYRYVPLAQHLWLEECARRVIISDTLSRRVCQVWNLRFLRTRAIVVGTNERNVFFILFEIPEVYACIARTLRRITRIPVSRQVYTQGFKMVTPWEIPFVQSAFHESVFALFDSLSASPPSAAASIDLNSPSAPDLRHWASGSLNVMHIISFLGATSLTSCHVQPGGTTPRCSPILAAMSLAHTCRAWKRQSMVHSFISSFIHSFMWMHAYSYGK